MLIAATVAFLLIKSLKGDIYSPMLLNPGNSPERVEQMRAQFGENGPLFRQYLSWIAGVLRGDLQYSSYYHKSVAEAIGTALPNTLQLMGLAYGSSIIGGILLGTWQGANEGTRGQRTSSAFTFTIFSLPDFWVAMMLQIVFVYWLKMLPPGGMSGTDPNPSLGTHIHDFFRYTTLPWLSLTIVDVAVFARYQRAAMRDVAGQQFLRTARAKGVPERLITWKHSLRVSLLPMITIAGLYFPALLVGAILIENVFSWPGVGQMLVKGVDNRDYYLVAGIVIVGSAMTALGSLLADVTREIVDPRLRT